MQWKWDQTFLNQTDFKFFGEKMFAIDFLKI